MRNTHSCRCTAATTARSHTACITTCSLQIVEQTKEIQGSTQVALADQREQMGRIEDDLDRVSDTSVCRGSRRNGRVHTVCGARWCSSS